ncbi:MAG: hypothetical protein AAGU03_02690, partial [Anaerolineaceae bacterium]
EGLAVQNVLIAENWEPIQQLVFGIQPAAYDDGLYSQWTNERQDIFGSPETRKAIAACLDANSLVREYLSERIPENLIPTEESLSTVNADPNDLLEEIGWVYTISDQGNFRVARNVLNVLDGTPLSLSLLTGQSLVDRHIAEKIVARLGQCNIPVAILSAALEELYRPGPEGSLFGRNFDLALVSWQTEHNNLCQLYTSNQIPSSINSWVGTNLAGLSSEEFDEACWAISTRNPGVERQDDTDLMAEYLPAIALMPHYRLWVASTRVNLPENTNFSDLWKFVPNQ